MKSIEEKNEEFILSLLHDIKTPMASINLALETLEIKDTEGRDTIKETLDEIYKVNRHNLKYIENLIENYSVKKGLYELKHEYFNLLNMVNEEIFALRFLIIEKKLKLNLISSNENIMVYTDKNLLRQAFLNLLTNAVKFSPPYEEIKVEISKNKKAVSLCVSNTITPGAFGERWQRGGLGQGIIKEALTKLNGKIHHTKNKDKICFYIDLPV